MTQHYIGTKQVIAWEQDKDGKPGYAVKYSDGYTSWSPKDVFEAAYLPMGHVGNLPPHQQRVVGELVELSDKLGKLRVFTHTSTFAGLPAAEQNLLKAQIVAMGDYQGILKQRVESFTDVGG